MRRSFLLVLSFALAPVGLGLLTGAAGCGGSTSSGKSAPDSSTTSDTGAGADTSTAPSDGGGRDATMDAVAQDSMTSPPKDGGASDTTTPPSTDGGVFVEGGFDVEAPDAMAAPLQITAPDDTWTWVNIPGAVCGNGSPTGIGINPHAGATHLLIYLQGGGACFTGDTCWGSTATTSDMTGYGASDFANDPTVDLSIFQRTNTGNPWNDADLVFVPYCTGDVHFGATSTTYTVSGVNNGNPIPTYFYGAKNIQADVASLALSLTGLTHVWLLGVSAGGFGSFLNQATVTSAFTGIPVDIVDDSGPAVDFPIPVSDLPWGVRIPAGCTGCMNLPDVYAFDRKTYPNSKYAFLTYQTDAVLPSFFLTSSTMFASDIQTFITSMASDPNAKSFQAESTGHVVLFGADPTATPYVLPWLTQMVNDDPAWANTMH
jgi:hypothetical protein